MANRPRKPSRAELAAAWGRTVPDVIAPGLRVLFCGINPSLYTAAVGYHFARPGNRFWPVLHGAGLTDRLLAPSEQGLLPEYGLGITNFVARATAKASELTNAELVAGAALLAAKLRRFRPKVLAVLGVTAYRAAFAEPSAQVGLQAQRIAGVPVWVLPNPSGLNAHYRIADLVALYRGLQTLA
ncbi:double-stranded uracil-DNA glycosylase [Alkalilimnicola ehrlichii]|uniref:Double-stranded uracil-DNA glycosylase n=1 Tax=Alkalilimnicola ehrlichii TaxID=351052 RepID=A0A3E0X2Q2_9GAMM|nr:G/U mismatch-specific DNA glycosylase [Alkalilimnicola ehrlichii]RFA30924.1 double-stranded uracil-DNA glycosylase [Alkalilimnicola ehrlichii]RFA38873.1 double-stranded uracil-DNA glycosylase [Alkalilimnicola ehrlichii]